MSFVVAAGADEPPNLSELSVEELMSVRISTVLRKPAPAFASPAAVSVLSGEEIRRAGVLSLPEALRLIPGVTVAQVDAHTWAITVRGFNSTTANKLEVQLDGRSLYTPLFSGVVWDIQDTLIDDIERIEVIRGPGASLWGANAVNGVINIVTRRPRDTHGSAVSLVAGDAISGIAEVRHGGSIPGGDYRVYAKVLDHEASHVNGLDADDGWRSSRAGFRAEWSQPRGSLSVQGEGFSACSTERVSILESQPNRLESRVVADRLSGGHLLARWQTQSKRGSDLRLQTYFDRGQRDIDGYFAERRNTFDLDFQHRPLPTSRHELLWGLGYRLSADDLEDTVTVSWQPDRRNLQLFSAFLQDEFELSRPGLKLIAGAKLEHNDFTGFELQPSLRLLWQPRPETTWWAAVTRAVRTPTRLERDVSLAVFLQPGSPDVPDVLFSFAGGAVASEELVAWELGHRFQTRSRATVETSLFYNDYDELVALTFDDDPALIDGRIEQLVPYANVLRGRSFGGEITAQWQLGERWEMTAWVSHLQLDFAAPAGVVAGGLPADSDPSWQASVRSSWSLPAGWQLDARARHIDRLPGLEVDSYSELDVTVSWNPSPAWRLSAIARNLLNSEHVEFGPGGAPVQRNVQFRLAWKGH